MGNIQRVVVRQSDIASHDVKSTNQIKLQQTTANQPSSTPSGSQTKMISAADLQKLISSGAVKTVTRTSVIPQTTASVSTPPTIRQVATNQQLAQQQVIGSMHSDTANDLNDIFYKRFFALVDDLISKNLHVLSDFKCWWTPDYPFGKTSSYKPIFKSNTYGESTWKCVVATRDRAES